MKEKIKAKINDLFNSLNYSKQKLEQLEEMKQLNFKKIMNYYLDFEEEKETLTNDYLTIAMNLDLFNHYEELISKEEELFTSFFKKL